LRTRHPGIEFQGVLIRNPPLSLRWTTCLPKLCRASRVLFPMTI